MFAIEKTLKLAIDQKELRFDFRVTGGTMMDIADGV